MRLPGSVLILFIVMSCSSFAQINTGRVSKPQRYTSDYFHFDVTIPKGWTLLAQSDIFNTNRQNVKVIQSEKQLSDSELKEQSQLMKTLLAVTQDTASRLPMVVFYTFNFDSALVASLSEQDYFDLYIQNNRSTYKSIGAEINFGQVTKTLLNGKEFYLLETTVNTNGFVAYQKMYVVKSRNKFLNLVVNYDSEEMLQRVNSLLRNIAWKE